MHKITLIVLYHLCTVFTCIQASMVHRDRALVAARQAVASAPLTSGSSASVFSTTSGLATLPTTVGITSNGTNAADNKLQFQNPKDAVAGTSAVVTPSGTSDSAIASSCLNNDISTVTESWQSYTVCLHDLLHEYYPLTYFRAGHGIHDKPTVCC